MTTTLDRRARPAPTHPQPARQDPRRFAARAKRWALGLSVAAFGVGWGLVSLNVVGVTNAASTPPSTTGGSTPHRATVPSSDFFGAPASQPQPILGNGGAGSGPVVTGRTS